MSWVFSPHLTNVKPCLEVKGITANTFLLLSELKWQVSSGNRALARLFKLPIICKKRVSIQNGHFLALKNGSWRSKWQVWRVLAKAIIGKHQIAFASLMWCHNLLTVTTNNVTRSTRSHFLYILSWTRIRLTTTRALARSWTGECPSFWWVTSVFDVQKINHLSLYNFSPYQTTFVQALFQKWHRTSKV